MIMPFKAAQPFTAAETPLKAAESALRNATSIKDVVWGAMNRRAEEIRRERGCTIQRARVHAMHEDKTFISRYEAAEQRERDARRALQAIAPPAPSTASSSAGNDLQRRYEAEVARVATAERITKAQATRKVLHTSKEFASAVAKGQVN